MNMLSEMLGYAGLIIESSVYFRNESLSDYSRKRFVPHIEFDILIILIYEIIKSS